MGSSLRDKTVHGVLWRFAQRISTQLVSFVVGLILARLLGPKAYGTVAMLLIFVNISETLVNCGFNVALVQKKDVTDADWSSVFYLQCFMSIVLYTVLFFAAPYIAQFYSNPELANVLRVQALILPIHAIQGIQTASIDRELRFNVSFIIGLSSSLAVACVGLIMAFSGFGYWSLVWSTLSGGVVSMFVACLFVRRAPKVMFSIKSLGEMFRFGGGMLASDFAGAMLNNITGLVIGRVYTPKDLACFERGKQLPTLVMDFVNSPLTTVSFPALSKVQTDIARMRSGMRKILMLSTFFIVPAMAGLSAVSDHIIWFLLGDEWVDAIPYAQIACISSAFIPFATVNLQGTKAIGRSGYYLAATIIKSSTSLLILLLFCRLGVLAIAIAFAAISTPIGLIVNAWPSGKFIGYRLLDQVKDVAPIMVISTLMAMIVWGLGCVLPRFSIVSLTIQILCGISVFYVTIIAFRPKVLSLVIDTFPKFSKLWPRLNNK